MKKTLKRHGSPEAITSDGLRSYKAAMNELTLSLWPGARSLYLNSLMLQPGQALN